MTYRIRLLSQLSLPSLTLLLATTLPLQASPHLTRIADGLPWPGTSQLIAYRDRVWFVNSEPFADTNVADVYSYSPLNRQIEYERSLFSQDTGNPVVHNGLLHWPFEDPRRSAAAGEYAITNGSDWQWRSMKSGSVMHVHAMNVCNENLVAVTGSWTGQFHVQLDDGSWQLQYDYPAGDAAFSRLVNVLPFDNRCIVGAAANGETSAKLFAMQGTTPDPIADWPSSDRVESVTRHQDDLFAFADNGDQRQLLRFDGNTTHRITLPANSRPRALHSDGMRLWLATQEAADDNFRGSLWLYNGSGEFLSLARIADTPIALTSMHEQVYIGTYHRSGGSLWVYGKESDGGKSNVRAKAALPPARSSKAVNAKQVDEIVAELSALLNDPTSTRDYAREIRHRLARHPRRYDAEFGAAISRLLQSQRTSTPVRMFTQRDIPSDELIRWYLILALAINGNGRINPAWISNDTPVTDHSSGKIFHTAVAAIVASGWLNQGDDKTVSALVERLNRPSDPEWLKADIIGALTAITDKRFAYDVKRWNQWWNSRP